MTHPDRFTQQSQTTSAMEFRTKPQVETPLIDEFMLHYTR